MREHRGTALMPVMAVTIAGLAGAAHGSLSVTEIGAEIVLGFDGFDGSGFDASPAPGQLDSDTWRVTGLSDGPGTFGGTYTTGDFARGVSAGGVGSGGVYAFEVGAGDTALGAQATGTDFTPGIITLRVRNDTGTTVTGFALEYDVYAFNDQDRSSSFDLGWSLDDAIYADGVGAAYISPELGDTEPVWEANHHAWMLSELTLDDGAEIYFRWQSDDVGGTGSRDELALDNLRITAVPGPPVLALLGLTAALRRRRRCRSH